MAVINNEQTDPAATPPPLINLPDGLYLAMPHLQQPKHIPAVKLSAKALARPLLLLYIAFVVPGFLGSAPGHPFVDRRTVHVHVRPAIRGGTLAQYRRFYAPDTVSATPRLRDL